MRFFITIAGICILTMVVSLGIYYTIPDDQHAGDFHWKYKQKEAVSRLLSIPILLYHAIDARGPFSIDSATLRAHFQLLRDRNITVISLQELMERLENPVPFDRKVVVLTFDDGHPSMKTALLPLVKEFKYPVTLFVYTDYIYNRSTRGLTWSDLRDLDAEGIDIQSHTISHADLTDIHDDDSAEGRRKLFEEIYLSRRLMEFRLGKEISLFAFPYGRYNLQLIDLVRRAGYGRAFSTDYGSNIITRDNYCLRRQHIKRSYSLEFFESLIR
jgi:peptidoglycan/xylan/chitin deacetylase (PgdA/CDA1 family)